MSLVNYSFTALKDTDPTGLNSVAAQAVSVKVDLDDSLAVIYSDSAGASPITQPGAVTDANGVLEFWVEAGIYKIESGTRTEISIIDNESRLEFDTTALMTASKHAREGDKTTTKEFSIGNGGGGTYDAVTTGTTPYVDLPNGKTILISTAIPSISFVQRPPVSEFKSNFVVSIPSTLPTLQDAVDFYQGATCTDDFVIELNIESGHALTNGLGVFGGDYGNFKITSVDATVLLDAAFVGVDTSSVPAGILAGATLDPLFFAYNANFPQLDCVVDMANDVLLGTGYMIAEGHGIVFPGKGVINAGFRGAQVFGRANLYNADFSGANGSGLRIQQGSSVNARNGIFDDCCKTSDDAAVYVSRASILEFRGGSAQNSVQSGLIARRARVNADDANFDNAGDKGVEAETTSLVSFANGSALGCSSNAVRSTSGSHVYMVGTDTSTTSAAINLVVNTGGRIDVAGSNIIEGVSGSESNIVAESDGVDWLNGFTQNGMVFYNDAVEEIIPFKSTTAGITADVGSVQGGSPLISELNEVSVCANIGDAVTLRFAKPGLTQTIINNGANACDVFPENNDNIGAGTNIAISLAAGSSVTYAAYSTANWRSI